MLFSGSAAFRDLDDGEHAFRLGAVAHLAQHALVDLFGVRVLPGEERRREVGRSDREPRVACAAHLARPLRNEEPSAPPLAPLPKPKHLLNARILQRRDHGQGESSRVWCQAPSRNRAKMWNTSARTHIRHTLRPTVIRMGRPLRDESPGYHHVVTRGNNKRRIFVDDDDRDFFCLTVDRIAARFGWRVLAYCLMGNHYHLVIAVGDRGLSDGMRDLNTALACRFNAKHGRINHLFGKRFWNRRVRTDASIWSTVRYVVQNPRRAGGSKPLEAYTLVELRSHDRCDIRTNPTRPRRALGVLRPNTRPRGRRVSRVLLGPWLYVSVYSGPLPPSGGVSRPPLAVMAPHWTQFDGASFTSTVPSPSASPTS